MAKTHAIINERFEHAEPKEVDGVVLSHLRVGSAQIVRGGKKIATLTVGVEKSVDDDEEPRLAIVLAPSEDVGYDAVTALTVEGDVAVKLADLVRAALPFLDPKSASPHHDTHPLAAF